MDETAQRTPEFDALKRAVQQAIEDEWPGKSRDKTFLKKLRYPFRHTEEKEYAGFADMVNGVYIQPWTKTRPGIVDALRVDITTPEDVWAGQIVRATVRAFTYDTSGNMGVSFNLDNLQVCRTDSPRLDGRRSASQDFDEYTDASAGGTAPRRGGGIGLVDDDDDNEPPWR